MLCIKCNTAAIKNQALGKEFWYCRTCKDEVGLPNNSAPHQMLIQGIDNTFNSSGKPTPMFKLGDRVVCMNRTHPKYLCQGTVMYITTSYRIEVLFDNIPLTVLMYPAEIIPWPHPAPPPNPTPTPAAQAGLKVGDHVIVTGGYPAQSKHGDIGIITNILSNISFKVKMNVTQQEFVLYKREIMKYTPATITP